MASIGINLCMGYVAYYSMTHVDVANQVDVGDIGGWTGGAWGGVENIDYGNVDLDAVGGLGAGFGGGDMVGGADIGGGDVDIGGMF